MLYAVKGNKQLKIDEKEKGAYLNLGYDIAKEEGGKLVPLEESPAKTVTAAQYKAVLDENAKLKEQVETIEKENKALKEKLAEANKKPKEANKE